MNLTHTKFTSLVVLAFFIFSSISTQAQVRYGAKAGLNISNISIVNGTSKSRNGLNVGVLALVPIDNNDQFFVQPEILYSNEGEYLVTKDGKGEFANFLDFIKVPILFKAYMSEAESDFFAEIGPYFAFKIGDKIEALDNPDEGQKFKSFDFGASIGLGYSFSRQFEVGARFSYGFVDMVENDWENKVNHSGVASLGITYILY